MTKIKNSIWSKVFSVFVSLAFVLTLLTSVNVMTANADIIEASPKGQEYFNCLYGIETGKYNVDGTYSTGILADKTKKGIIHYVKNDPAVDPDNEYAEEFYSLTYNDRVFLAKSIFEDTVDGLTDADKVEVSKSIATFDKLWADVYAAPEAAKEMIVAELAGLADPEYKVVFEDKATFDAVKEVIAALDENQQTYVKTYIYFLDANNGETQTVYNKYYEVVEAKIAALDADIERVIGKINNTLGDILAEGVEYADKVAYDDVVADLATLDAGSQTYVENNSTFTNIADVDAALRAIEARLDALVEDINVDLGSMIENGVTLADLAAFNTIDTNHAAVAQVPAEYAYVTERATVANVETVRDLFDAYYLVLDALVEDINVDLQDMIDNGITLADETAFDTIADAYGALNTEDKAYVDEKATEENVATVEQMFVDYYAVLDEFAGAINNTLGEMLTNGVKYADKPVFDDIDDAYTALQVPELALELAYVNENAEEGNIEEVRAALLAIEARLDEFVNYINNDLAEMLERGVTIADLEPFAAFAEDFEAMAQDEAELAYVTERSNMQNCEDVADALVAIIERLALVAVDVEYTLGEMLERGVVYADKPAFDVIDKAYADLTADEQAFVNALVLDEEVGTDVREENIEEVRAALRAIETRLDELVEDINVDLGNMLENGVTIADVQPFLTIAQAYTDLESVPAELAYVNEHATEENIEAVANALSDILEKLFNVIDGIEVDLAGMLAEGVEYADKTRFDEVDEAYKALSADEKAFVDGYIVDEENGTDVREENIEDVRAELEAIEARLDELVEDINVDLQNMIDNGVTLADKAAFDAIDALYEAEKAVPAELAYVNENATEENIETVRAMFDAYYDVLDELVEDINVDLQEMIDNGVTLADEAAFDKIADAYEALNAEDKAYVDEYATEENIETVQGLFDDIYAELDALVADINDVLGGMLTEGVEYADKPAYDTIQEAYDALDTPETALELAYVNEKANEENLDKVAAELAKIEERLDVIVEDINVDLQDMIDNGVTLADKPAFDAIDNAYNALATVPAEQAYVNENATEENIETVRSMFDEVYAELDALADRIDTELGVLLPDNVTYADKELFDEINDAYTALPAEEQAYVNENAREENLDEVAAKLEAIEARLDELVEDINVDLGDMLERGVTLDDQAAFDVIDALYNETATIPEERAYVDEKATEENIEAVREALNNLYDELAGIIEDIIAKSEEDSNGDGIPGDGLKESDLEAINKVVSEYAGMDEAQQEQLYDIIGGEGTYDTFEDAVNLFKFSIYFKEAVNEMASQVAEGYFTVEGYAIVKALYSMYNTFTPVERNLVSSCLDTLIATNDAYDVAMADEDVLDYNKVREELLEDIAELQAQVDSIVAELTNAEGTGRVDVLESELAALKTRLDTAKAELDQAVDALEAVTEAQAAELEKLAGDLLETNEALDAVASRVGNIESYLTQLKATIMEDVNRADKDLDAKITALQAANANLKKELDDKTGKLNKTMIIGFIAAGAVAVVLFGCVISLFGKVKAVSHANNAGNAEEADDDAEEENK